MDKRHKRGISKEYRCDNQHFVRLATLAVINGVLVILTGCAIYEKPDQSSQHPAISQPTPERALNEFTSQNSGLHKSSTQQEKSAADDHEDFTTSSLRLTFFTDREQIGPGQCASLLLKIANVSKQSVKWGENYIFEQEGPPPRLPMTFPRSTIYVNPGQTIEAMNTRMCYENLVAGGRYRFRISGAPTEDAPHSNWVYLESRP